MYLNEGEKSKEKEVREEEMKEGKRKVKKRGRKGELYIIRWSLQISTKTQRG